MKYIKTFELTKEKYVTPEEKDIMKQIRSALLKYFGAYSSISVTKEIKSNLIHIKIYSGAKDAATKKFIDVMEYIGIGRKFVFSTTIEKLKEIINIIRTNKVTEISELISQSKKYNL